ncbi:CRISPR-associated endonuclease Cas2 [Fumia xinanensis]|uniref:CRISPR-associated endonuclease Cas2 n=1 Tax=Fumia xinanensis TaxID=2763659 RepID=UPI003211C597
MLIVATYDVDVTSPSGAKRLRRVARICEKWGIRVQNSVFELLVDQAQFVTIRAALEKVIDPEKTVSVFTVWGNIMNRRFLSWGSRC